jgi:hypothetical protein
VCEECLHNARAIVDPAHLRLAVKPGLREVIELAEKLPMSTQIPVTVFSRVKATAELIVRELQTPVLEECVRQGILTPDKRDGAIHKAAKYALDWALVCLAIGVEQALGHLPGGLAPMYLTPIARAYGLHAAFAILEMERRGALAPKEAYTRSDLLVDTVMTFGSNLGQFRV